VGYGLHIVWRACQVLGGTRTGKIFR
jgi:hypothetical protein